MSEVTNSDVVLRLEGVRKSYDGVPVLNGITTSVASHEVIAVIGASGSGKSTLLRTINLLEQIDDGQIWLRDANNDLQDISAPTVKADAVRARIGFVFQHLNLFPHLTVLDNVTLASRNVLKIPRMDAERTGLALLDRIGLADKAKVYPDQLSGGQQQRAAIVRAIATNPELLLLDEITSALDPELVGEVLELVRELGAEGTTIVMATHEMAFARDVATRVLFLDRGVIAEEGTPAQVFGSPRNERTKEFLARFNS